MRIKKWVTGSVAVAGLLAVSAAHAAPPERGFYFGFNGGQVKYDEDAGDADQAIRDVLLSNGFFINSSQSDLDDSDTAFAGYVGYRILPYLAVEAGYVDLGEFEYTSNITATPFFGTPTSVVSKVTAGAKGPLVSVMGIWPASDTLELYARSGLFISDTEFNANVRIGNVVSNVGESHNSADAMLGLGAALNVGSHWTFRLEYQRYGAVGDEDTTGETNIDSLHLGVVVRL